MHYGNIRFYPLDPVDKFTMLFPKDQVHVRRRTNHIRLHTRRTLSDKPTVYVLQPTTNVY